MHAKTVERGDTVTGTEYSIASLQYSKAVETRVHGSKLQELRPPLDPTPLETTGLYRNSALDLAFRPGSRFLVNLK